VACKDRLDELTVADWRRLLNLPSGNAMRAVRHHFTMHIAVIISVQIVKIFILRSFQLWLGSRRPLLRLSMGL
jgi:hypothetical protein